MFETAPRKNPFVLSRFCFKNVLDSKKPAEVTVSLGKTATEFQSSEAWSVIEIKLDFARLVS